MRRTSFPPRSRVARVACVSAAQTDPRRLAGTALPWLWLAVALLLAAGLAGDASADPTRAVVQNLEMPTPPATGSTPVAKQSTQPSGCLTLAVRAVEPHTGIFLDGFEDGDTSAWSAPNRTFSARALADLELVAQVSRTVGESLLHLELTSPRGHHYQTLDLPLAPASVVAAGAVRHVAGYPRPLAVHILSAATSSLGQAVDPVVTAHWPVAGTNIVTAGLYGTWTLGGRIDGPGGGTCPSATFGLRP